MTTTPHPDISVLVPVYGVERYIADCARSLFAQRDVTAEYIFVDDASTDSSIDRLRAVAATYPHLAPRIRVLRHDRNRGVTAARSTAAAAAQGDYLLYVDPDDALTDDRVIATLLAEARHTDADLLFGGYLERRPDGDRPVPLHHTTRETMLRSLLRQDYRTDNRLWGLLIRRTLHQHPDMAQPAGIDFAEDYMLLTRLLYRARRVATVDRPLYAYRTASAGSYMSRLTRRSADAYVAANGVVSDFMRRQPDYTEWHKAAMQGKLNIEKWILKRGFSPAEYHDRLFAAHDAPCGLLQRLYAAALRTEWLPLVRAVAAVANSW